ncbi:MAG: M48 family metalloprotease [Bacteroidetes bacterium]|nr:M48 family metalloprotease [Bacteroidota bacterium]
MRFLFVILLICIGIPEIYGQDKPLKSNNGLKQHYLEEIEVQYRKDITQLKSSNDPLKDDLKKIYKIRWMANVNRTEAGYYVFDYKWLHYLDLIQEEISKKNMHYDMSNIKVVLGRYNIANAFSVGDGTIVLDIGLLPHLENEDQLAFILCHEFSHVLLNHWKKTIDNKLRSYNSSIFRNKLSKIKETDYYQVTKLKALIKENLYAERELSRDMETEADSLGMQLFLNTKYASKQAARCMLVLDSVQHSRFFYQPIDVFKALHSPRVQIPKETFIDPVDESESFLNNDSLMSHPMNMMRHEALSRFEKKSKYHNDKIRTASDEFEELRRISRNEVTESLLTSENYDKALLYSLRKLALNPEDKKMGAAATLSLYRLYEARKNHNVSYYASPPHETNDTSYAQLTNYIYAVRFSQMLDDLTAYCNKYYNLDPENEDLLYCMIMVAKANNDFDSYRKFRSRYFEKFDKGKYSNLIPKQ